MNTIKYILISVVAFFLLGLTTKHYGTLGTSSETNSCGSHIKNYNYWVIEVRFEESYYYNHKIRIVNFPFGIEDRYSY